MSIAVAPVGLWTSSTKSSVTSSFLKDFKAIIILQSWSCMADTTWFDFMYINLHLRWWNPVSDPRCPENTYSVGDECVGWSRIKGSLETFGQDWWSPYACIFCILYGIRGWSFPDSTCCEAVVALLWGGFVIDSELNTAEGMHSSHLEHSSSTFTGYFTRWCKGAPSLVLRDGNESEEKLIRLSELVCFGAF